MSSETAVEKDRSQVVRRQVGEKRRGAARVAVALTSSAGGLLLLAAVFGWVAAELPWTQVVQTYALTNSVIGSGFLFAGFLIAWHRPHNRLGWLFLVCSIGHLITAATVAPLAYGLENNWSATLLRSLSGLGSAWLLGIIGLFPLALMLFPDGRFLTSRWRAAGGLVVLVLFVQLVVDLTAGDFRSAATDAEPTVGPVDIVLNILNVAILVLVFTCLTLRYIRGDERTRRQLLWLILAFLAMALLNSQRWITGDGPILLLLSFVFVPVAIAIAVLRYELLDIRLVLSRTLVYVSVSLVIIALYAGLVAGISVLVPTGYGRAVTVASALVVAVAFNPLRVLFQRLITSAFYGLRSDPIAALTHMGDGLGAADDLAAVLERIRATLRLPALKLSSAHSAPVLVGAPPLDGATAVMPLVHRGQAVGEILVSLRRGDRELHQRDKVVLDLISTSLASALNSQHLAQEVTLSRAALVGAHETERLRLQRELHDGLGPTLTGAAFRADAAQNLLLSDPDRSLALMTELRVQIRQAVDEVRRVVYGLRPVELDERGLLGALQAYTKGTYRSDGVLLQVTVTGKGRLSALSPAVELAAFRIVTEAITNVIRHTTALTCDVVLTQTTDGLLIQVSDDADVPGLGPAGEHGDNDSTVSGAGVGTWNPGVGLGSMKQRAAELGGWVIAEPTAGGGRVRALLPNPPDA